MRIHLLSVPNTQVVKDAYPLDGFCLRTWLFADLCVRLGHQVILYGVETTDAPCSQFVQVMTDDQRLGYIGGPTTPYQYVRFDAQEPLFQAFNKDVSNHLRVLKQPGDVLATIVGSAAQGIADAHPDLTFLEFSVGYTGVATHAHRVYQSAAWQHTVYGFTGMQGGRVCDAVIPPWFPLNEFPYTARPDPYVIYCGRLIPNKGLSVACEAAKRAGMKLLIVGHGDHALVTHGADFLGAVSTEERNRLLSQATACLMPTQYLEPFGNVAAEAQLCGTPMITTDYGAFVESVEHGQTGYRCNSLGEFVQAIELAHDLDRSYIRKRAVGLYTTDAAMRSYTNYFRRLKALRDEGWRDLSPGLLAEQTA